MCNLKSNWYKSAIEPLSGVEFNSVLLNLYRDGRDSVAWHSDDEPELGINPVIGSVSFGASRRFVLKHRYKTNLKQQIDLSHGNFLLMKGLTHTLLAASNSEDEKNSQIKN